MTRYLFGGFALDTDTVEVHGPDGPCSFEPQVYDVLLYLVEQRGRLVTKEELLDNVWGDRFISESAMTTRIKQARRLVGDDGRTQWAIKTVHGRGYRFVADIAVDGGGPTGGAATAGPAGTITADDGDPRSGAGPVTDAGRSGPPAPGAAAPGAADHRATGTGAADPAVAGAPPMAPLPGELVADARRLFVGRDDETAAAAALIDRPAGDPVRWIWLLGEPGIGKTRTAAEIAQQAHARGHRVLFGRNSEDLTVPYQPVIEAMRSVAAGFDGADLLDRFGPRSAELVPLLPELAAALPADDAGPAPSSALDDNSRRYQLMEAIADWFAHGAARRPTVLVIDDVHWAADSTLQFLAHLRQRAQPCALTVVATARDTAPDENPKVADLVAADPGSDRVLALRLTGLSDEAAARLVGGDADLAQAMQQTAGNPLLLQALNPEDPSVDLRSAVRRRLASLSERVQQVLSVAAVIGLEFDLKIAASALDRPELDVLDDLEQAMAARLLLDVGVDRFRFAHALVRSSLRDDISSGRRTRWHARVAEAIERVFPGDRSQVPALAHHTAEAAAADPALRGPAVERLRRAAAVAIEQLSFGEAIDHLQRARALADPDDPHLQAELALAQGDAESRTGASSVAIRTYDAAVAHARRAGDAQLLAVAAILYTSVSWRPGTADDSTLQHNTEALAALDRAVAGGAVIDDEQNLRAHLHIGTVRAHAMLGQFRSTDAAYHEAWALIEPMGDPELEGELVAAYLSDLRPAGRREVWERLLDRLGEVQPHLRNRETLLLALQVRLHYAVYTCRFDEQRRVLDDMRSTSEATGSTFWRHIATNDDAMVAFFDGDLAATEELAERCLELADRLPGEDGSGTYGLRMFAVRREQDRLAGLGPLVRHLMATNPAEAFWTPGLAYLSAETGQLADARAIMDDFKARRFAIPADAMWSTVLSLLAETAATIDDVEACTMLHEVLSPLSTLSVVTGHGILSFGSADRYLAMLSLACGELDRADRELTTAVELDGRNGSLLWLNHSRLWLARLRRLQGRNGEADGLFGTVLDEARGSGLARLQRLAEEGLAG